MAKLIHRICSGPSGAPPAMLEHTRTHEGEDEPGQHDHLDPDVLHQVVVETPTALDRGDDRGEVVVGEDHLGGVLGDLRAGDPHRDARCRRGRAQARSFTPSPVMATTFPCCLSMLTSRTLSSGATANDTDLVDLGQSRVVGKGGELGAGEGAPFDPQLAGDGGSGGGVITGDHPARIPAFLHRAMASPASLRGGSTIRSGRADRGRSPAPAGRRPDRTWRDEVGRATASTRRPSPARRSFSASTRSVASPADRGGRARPYPGSAEAHGQQHVSGAPLTKHRTTARPSSSISWNVAISLYSASKGTSATRGRSPGLLHVEPGPWRRADDQRPLGGITDARPVADHGIVGQCHRQHERLQRAVIGAGDPKDVPRRRSTLTVDVEPAADEDRAVAVIWLRVSVPVLSEQMAEVEPSVSTDLSRLTMAPFAASSACPSRADLVTTAGRPVGMAEMARLIPIVNSFQSSRARPSTTIRTSAPRP